MSVQATTWVWNHSQATESAFLVLLALADHAHPDGTHAYPSLASLQRMTRLSERTVRYALRTLESIGEIEITREGGGRGRTTEYRLSGMGAVLAPIPPERVQSATQKGQQVAPEPNNPTTKATPIPNRVSRRALAGARQRRTASEDVSALLTKTRQKLRAPRSNPTGGY